MRRTFVAVLAAVLGVLALAPTASAGENFVAPLSGGEEVPARDTLAVGVATFKLLEDGAALPYKINVANLHNVTAAHIHCAATGVNGPVGVTLFTAAPA
jgi:CHRD domain